MARGTKHRDKMQELRGQTDEALYSLVKDLRRKLWKARFDNAINQLEDTSQLRKLRRELARVLTVLRERELGLQRGQRQRAG